MISDFSGALQSDKQILVTSENDDLFQGESDGPDEQDSNLNNGFRGDPTHRISSLKDTIKLEISYDGQPLSVINRPVIQDWSKVMKVTARAVVFRLEAGGTPAVSNQYVMDDVSRANRRLAQANIMVEIPGINGVANIELVDPEEPLINEGLRHSALFNNTLIRRIPSPFRRVITDYTTKDKEMLELFYVNHISTLNAVGQWVPSDQIYAATVTSFTVKSGRLPLESRGCVILPNQSSYNGPDIHPNAPATIEDRFSIVTAHEIGHALSDQGHYNGDPPPIPGHAQWASPIQDGHFQWNNLMMRGAMALDVGEAHGPRRLWDHQVVWLRNGALTLSP